ncbi:hypothetical protein [Streptomyces sp. NPDC006333]|uniref:hypothetical protein n=1 Tax=Streptomyces sp. NPDC006333 TaxID=3156753 RepID=UPI0033A36B56
MSTEQLFAGQMSTRIVPEGTIPMDLEEIDNLEKEISDAFDFITGITGIAPAGPNASGTILTNQSINTNLSGHGATAASDSDSDSDSDSTSD